MDYKLYASHPNKTIVAVMEQVDENVFKHIRKRMPHLDFSTIDNLIYKMNLPKRLVGKATCNLDEDFYNENVGCKIAEYRLRQKYNRLLMRVYSALALQMHKDAMFAIGMAEKYEYSLDVEDRYIHY